MALGDGLVPVALASGGTAWLQAPAASGLRLPASSGSAGGSTATLQQPIASIPGAILGSLPVSSPFGLAAPQQTAGPAGFIPQQIQTAYGLSTGSAYNNTISFGAIKGDGTGQTIGIYEEGYNPAFVDTSDPSYGTSALAQFRQDLRPARPAQPDLRRPYRHTDVGQQQQQQQPRLRRLRRRPRDRAGHRVGACHGALEPSSSSSPPFRTPTTFSMTFPWGSPRWRGCPASRWSRRATAGSSISSALESLEQTWDSTIIQPALAANPNVSVFAASGDDGAEFGLIYPSASPEVVSVGGTSLFVTPSGTVEPRNWLGPRRRRFQPGVRAALVPAG